MRDVCEEAGVPISKADEIEIVNMENPATRELMNKLPHLTLEHVAKKVTGITKENLIIYEAARRQRLKELADHFLNKWKTKLEEKMLNKFGDESLWNAFS